MYTNWVSQPHGLKPNKISWVVAQPMLLVVQPNSLVSQGILLVVQPFALLCIIWIKLTQSSWDEAGIYLGKKSFFCILSHNISTFFVVSPHCMLAINFDCLCYKFYHFIRKHNTENYWNCSYLLVQLCALPIKSFHCLIEFL